MALRPGTQKTASAQVTTFFPGDPYGGQTAVTLAANGIFALGDVVIGNAVFYAPNGNQAASNITAATTSVIAGIAMRNQGLAPLGWNASQDGYGLIASEGSQLSVFIGGKIGALITGVNTSGAADHVPILGDLIWVKTSDGTFGAVPASVTTVTGYVRAFGLAVLFVGQYNPFITIGANQTLGVIAGNLSGV